MLNPEYLNDSLNAFKNYVVETKSITASSGYTMPSMSPGEQKAFLFNIAKSGYIAVGLVGYGIYGVNNIYVAKILLESINTVTLELKNNNSAQANISTINLLMLYLKQ